MSNKEELVNDLMECVDDYTIKIIEWNQKLEDELRDDILTGEDEEKRNEILRAIADFYRTGVKTMFDGILTDYGVRECEDNLSG